MTTTEWFTDIALILIVFRQLREGRLGPRSYLLPLGIVSFVAYKYLHTVPTGGNDRASTSRCSPAISSRDHRRSEPSAFPYEFTERGR